MTKLRKKKYVHRRPILRDWAEIFYSMAKKEYRKRNLYLRVKFSKSVHTFIPRTSCQPC